MLELIFEKRNVFGNKLVKSRKHGKLPVVTYGANEKSEAYFVNTHDFDVVFKEAGESTIVTFVSGDEKKDLLIHEVAYDPVSDRPVHADFYVIEKGRKVRVKVPIKFEGIAPAIKNLGGVLVKVLYEIEVEAEAKDLPHEIIADVASLVDFDCQLTVGDLTFPMGVRSVTHADEIVALAAAQKEEKEEESAPIDLSKIEVEKKGKKLEEGSEPETAPNPKKNA